MKIYRPPKKYADHKKKWSDCKDCELCKTRNKVVLARGKIPCDVLFIGEAPGASEDVIGRPFVGPAGHLLDRIVSQAVGESVSCLFTNLVACIPKGEDGNKLTEPEQKHIEACHGRLAEIVKLANPIVTVIVGKLAGKWVPKHFGRDDLGEVVEIVHPAAILRADVTQQGLLFQRAVVCVRDAVLEAVEN